MVIESGPAWVIEHGVVTTFGGHPLTLVLQLPEDNLAVELHFVDDGGDPDVRTEETPTGYRLHCVNFGDASGRGSAEPVLLGQIAEDLLFMHFRVFRFGLSIDRTVQFTFYRARKARLGWTPAPGSG